MKKCYYTKLTFLTSAALTTMLASAPLLAKSPHASTKPGIPCQQKTSEVSSKYEISFGFPGLLRLAVNITPTSPCLQKQVNQHTKQINNNTQTISENVDSINEINKTISILMKMTQQNQHQTEGKTGKNNNHHKKQQYTD